MQPKEWKVFWRIIFDVIDGKIRLRQEIEFWELDTIIATVGGDMLWTRRDRIMVDLLHVVKGEVTVKGDRAIFHGGYIEGRTVNLEAYIQNRLSRDVKAEEMSEAVQGLNVSVQANVKLDPSPLDVPQPIFYFPQPSSPPSGKQGSVRLIVLPEIVKAKAGGRSQNGYQVLAERIQWILSNMEFTSGRYFRLAHFDGWHTLSASQDVDPDSGKQVYELVGGVIQLDRVDDTRPGKNHGRHAFHTQPVSFFIGAMPPVNKGGSIQVLLGEISHLVFDPNSSCASCAS